MIPFEKYKGKTHKKMPIDIGRKILKLNWSLSSHMIDTYVYQNNAGDLFYVTGVWQHPDISGVLFQMVEPDRHYHLVLVTQFISRDLLVQYLRGKIQLCDVLDHSGKSYILKLGAPTYNYFNDMLDHNNITMHPVISNGVHTSDDGTITHIFIEKTRKIELEVSKFEFKECKECLSKNLPYIYRPENAYGTYDHRKKLAFIFISEKEKKQIDVFIKNNSK